MGGRTSAFAIRIRRRVAGGAAWACLFCAIPLAFGESSPTNRSAAAEAPGAESVLRDLEKKISDVKTVQSGFIQEKKLSIMERKLVLEGWIALENPGRFAWHVDTPVRYAMVIEGGVLRQWDEDTRQVQRMALGGNPVFKAVTEQLASWFAGRYSSLGKDYQVALAGRRPTILKFTPRPDSPSVKAIRSVTVSFREDERYLSELTIEDITGDTTRLTFVKTVLNEPIPATAWKVEPRD